MLYWLESLGHQRQPDKALFILAACSCKLGHEDPEASTCMISYRTISCVDEASGRMPELFLIESTITSKHMVIYRVSFRGVQGGAFTTLLAPLGIWLPKNII